jgi:hypothetical protein
MFVSAYGCKKKDRLALGVFMEEDFYRGMKSEGWDVGRAASEVALKAES